MYIVMRAIKEIKLKQRYIRKISKLLLEIQGLSPVPEGAHRSLSSSFHSVQWSGLQRFRLSSPRLVVDARFTGSNP